MNELNGDWSACRLHVLQELQRLDECHKDNHNLVVTMRTDLAIMETSIAILKLKYAIYGGLIGAIPGILALVLRFT